MKITQFYCYNSICIILIVSICAVKGLGRWPGATKKTKCLNPPRTARRVEIFIKECQEEVKNKLILEAYQILKDEVSKEHPSIDENDDSISLIEEDSSNNHPTIDSYLPQFSPAHNHHEYVHEEEQPSFDEDNGDEEEREAQSEDEELLSQHYKHTANAANDSYLPIRRHRVARLLHRIRRVGGGDGNIGLYHPTLVPFEDKRIAGCLLHCVYAKNSAIDKRGWPTLDGLVHFYSEGVNEHAFFMATLRSVNLCLRAASKKYNINRNNLPERGESCDLAFDVFDCIADQITGYCLDQYRQ